MSSPGDSSVLLHSATAVPARAPVDTPEFVVLRKHVGDALSRRAADIATRWARQARSVALRDEDPTDVPADGGSAGSIVEAMADALRSDVHSTDATVALGLAFGTDAFERGTSLHHTLKGLDLLTAMSLYAIESDLGELLGQSGTAADGIRLGRRIQQSASLLTIATTKGYTQAVGDGMRDQFRALRHDLRNPLGTIKNVLAMMHDETLPVDARTHPRFRAMADRNAHSLEKMISARLSDVAALLPNTTSQEVSLRTVACSVRRDLRADIEARGMTVAVGPALSRVRLDASSLELILLALLQAAVEEGSEGEELVIDFGEVAAGRATVVMECEPARPPVADPEAIERLTALAVRLGARMEAGARVVLSVPVRSSEDGEAPSPSPSRSR